MEKTVLWLPAVMFFLGYLFIIVKDLYSSTIILSLSLFFGSGAPPGKMVLIYTIYSSFWIPILMKLEKILLK